MTDTNRVLVGREATPEPPGLGSSTLSEVLQLDELKEFAGRRGLMVLSDSAGRHALRNQGFNVFPAVPGLVDQALRTLRPGALIVDSQALEGGPWAGALTDAAPELLAELTGAVATARELGVSVYWLGEVSKDADHPLVTVAEQSFVITPGSELYEGTVEGAPPSRLTRVLRTLVS